VVKTIKEAGGIAVASYDSVAEEKSAQRIIDTAINNFGRIDILVNNAGVVRDPSPVFDLSTDDWEILMRTHLFGTFYTTRYACKFMKEQKYGRIINTSSCRTGWEGFPLRRATGGHRRSDPDCGRDMGNTVSLHA
jgi:NAD(P)-dependent dehydrogenase (short-subunit alcohol dehydrogenase family)